MKQSHNLVSVCCITYNHEKYIAQALDGMLMQKCNFDYKIVVGEDCSTDNTRRIVLQYAEQFPSRFTLLFHEKNVGAGQNSMLTLRACTGKFIAMCEGDDYWTDPYKLQKQVDFLESNPGFSGVAHQSRVKYEDSSKEGHVFRNHVKPILYLKDLLAGRFFHTASFVFRTKVVCENQMPLDITSGDRALFLLCATYGPIQYMSEPMCVYRKSSLGISSWVTYDLLIKDLKIVPWIKAIYPAFPEFQYLAFIHRTIVTYPKQVPLRARIKHWSLFALYSFSYFPRNIYEILRMLIKI